MQQSIFKTARMVAFIHEGVAQGENKNYEEHLERVWEDVLEDEFPLPIQTPAIPSVCPPKELPSSSTCQTPAIPSVCPPEGCQTSLKLRTPCKKCAWINETKTKRITHFKADAQSQVSNCYK